MHLHQSRLRIYSVMMGLLLPSIAMAHDVWITTLPNNSGMTAVTIHHGHPGDRKVPDPDKLIELLSYRDRGLPESLLSGVRSIQREGLPLLVTETDVTGTSGALLVLAARYDNGYWVKTREGHRNTSKLQVPDTEDSLYSMKFAKVLIRADHRNTEAGTSYVGHRLELIPLHDPFTLHPGDILKVRVEYKGRPLAGVDVEGGDGFTPVQENEILKYRTDEHGVAHVKIIKNGPQLLVVDHRVPSEHRELAETDLYNATLSFLLP